MRRSVYVNRPVKPPKGPRRRLVDAGLLAAHGLGVPLTIVLTVGGTLGLCVLVYGAINLLYNRSIARDVQAVATEAALRENTEQVSKAAEQMSKATQEMSKQRGSPGSLTDEVRERLRAATVLIVAQQQDGWRSEGTGFIVSPDGLIATSAHVIDYGRTREVGLVLDSGTERVRWTTPQIAYCPPPPPVDSDRQSTEEAGQDIALLRIAVSEALPALPLGSASKVGETEDVIAVGFPLGTALDASGSGPVPSFAKGAVSRIQRGPDGGVILVEHSASLEGGNSGGPLVLPDGAVIGVNVGTAGERISAAVPADRVSEAVASLGLRPSSPAPQPGQTQP
jgi:S1-C subfamily serine protease